MHQPGLALSVMFDACGAQKKTNSRWSLLNAFFSYQEFFVDIDSTIGQLLSFPSQEQFCQVFSDGQFFFVPVGSRLDPAS